MIKLTKTNDEEITINVDLIATITKTHDAVYVRLLNDRRLLVKESEDEIIEKVINYKSKVANTNFLIAKEE